MLQSNNMKKIFLFLAVSFFVVAPLVAQAQVNIEAKDKCNIGREININSGGRTIDCPTGEVSMTSGDGAMCCLVNSIYNIVDWIFVILVALAGIFIIIGAMNIITAGGDSAKVDTGRKYIMYAAIGLFVAFLARAIPTVVVSIIG